MMVMMILLVLYLVLQQDRQQGPDSFCPLHYRRHRLPCGGSVSCGTFFSFFVLFFFVLFFFVLFFFVLFFFVEHCVVYLASGQVLRICTERNKTFPPSTSLPVMGEIAGVNTASLGGYLHCSETRARWAEGFHDEQNGHVFNLERDGLRHVVPSP